jgi:hypothetical protein
MNPSQDPPKPSDLPWAVRIMPTRNTWWGSVLIGLGIVSVLLWAWHDPRSPLGRELFWATLGLNVATAILLAGRALLQLPMIEASELGIAIWLYGPYRRPFFAPWKRVRTIVLTQARGARRPRAPMRPALGIGLVQDSQFHLPPNLRCAETAAGAEPADLVWSSARIRGDPRRWVELLQRMKHACTQAALAEPGAP